MLVAVTDASVVDRPITHTQPLLNCPHVRDGRNPLQRLSQRETRRDVIGVERRVRYRACDGMDATSNRVFLCYAKDGQRRPSSEARRRGGGGGGREILLEQRPVTRDRAPFYNMILFLNTFRV